jgi:pilus assembly protein Flp/PilA
MGKIKGFLWDENGASAVEYGLLVSLIAVAIIAGATTLGTKVNGLFNATAGKISIP